MVGLEQSPLTTGVIVIDLFFRTEDPTSVVDVGSFCFKDFHSVFYAPAVASKIAEIT